MNGRRPFGDPLATVHSVVTGPRTRRGPVHTHRPSGVRRPPARDDEPDRSVDQIGIGFTRHLLAFVMTVPELVVPVAATTSGRNPYLVTIACALPAQMKPALVLSVPTRRSTSV